MGYTRTCCGMPVVPPDLVRDALIGTCHSGRGDVFWDSRGRVMGNTRTCYGIHENVLWDASCTPPDLVRDARIGTCEFT